MAKHFRRPSAARRLLSNTELKVSGFLRRVLEVFAVFERYAA
jgi:hypothetical protein